jgi:hypothetical protein
MHLAVVVDIHLRRVLYRCSVRRRGWYRPCFARGEVMRVVPSATNVGSAVSQGSEGGSCEEERIGRSNLSFAGISLMAESWLMSLSERSLAAKRWRHTLCEA